jgi:hypothetical protein
LLQLVLIFNQQTAAFDMPPPLHREKAVERNIFPYSLCLIQPLSTHDSQLPQSTCYHCTSRHSISEISPFLAQHPFSIFLPRSTLSVRACTIGEADRRAPYSAFIRRQDRRRRKRGEDSMHTLRTKQTIEGKLL